MFIASNVYLYFYYKGMYIKGKIVRIYVDE